MEVGEVSARKCSSNDTSPTSSPERENGQQDQETSVTLGCLFGQYLWRKSYIVVAFIVMVRLAENKVKSQEGKVIVVKVMTQYRAPGSKVTACKRAAPKLAGS